MLFSFPSMTRRFHTCRNMVQEFQTFFFLFISLIVLNFVRLIKLLQTLEEKSKLNGYREIQATISHL